MLFNKYEIKKTIPEKNKIQEKNIIPKFKPNILSIKIPDTKGKIIFGNA